MSECCDLFNICCCSGESCEYSTDVSPRLHGDDSELVFFVDPNKEGLLVVVEDTSSLGPVSVQATGIKESISFFEKEVVSNQLILLFRSHGSERIEGTGKLTLKSVASLNDLLLNLVSLLSCNSWSERVVLKVTSYSNSGGLDHGCVRSRERWALKFGVVHVTDVTSTLGMAMVLLDDLVHHWSKSRVRIMRSSIDTNS